MSDDAKALIAKARRVVEAYEEVGKVNIQRWATGEDFTTADLRAMTAAFEASVQAPAVDEYAMPKRWERYVRDCTANGIEHDCAHEFIDGWPLEDFESWLRGHDAVLGRKAEARGLEKAGAEVREWADSFDEYNSIDDVYAAMHYLADEWAARAQQVREGN